MTLLLLLATANSAVAILVTGDQLRFCRELNYDFVLSSAAAEELSVPAGAIQNADQQLINRYAQLAARPEGTPRCLFHWKNLMCSYVFPRSDATPACAVLCDKVAHFCDAFRPDVCAAQETSTCTDYAELTGLCASYESRGGSGAQPTPRPGDVSHLSPTWVLIAVLSAIVIIESVFR